MNKSQIDILAEFIMADVDGEPSLSEGAGDTAIRIIKQLQIELAGKKEEADVMWEGLNNQIVELQAELDNKKPCEWVYDDREEYWATSCEEAYVLLAGNPEENRMKFCCYCGKPIILPEQALKGGK